MKEFKRYAGVIIKSNNKVLLCKRSPNDSMPNQWSIPVGHINKDELPEQAAHREFKEETNIKLPKNIDLVGIINKYAKDGTTKNGVFFVYLHESEKEIMPDLDNAKDGFEHTQCKYFTKKNIPVTRDTQDLVKIMEKILK
jgi:ADP-ribose pyrophosphatase YjhB (NUDIX family)